MRAGRDYERITRRCTELAETINQGLGLGMKRVQRRGGGVELMK